MSTRRPASTSLHIAMGGDCPQTAHMLVFTSRGCARRRRWAREKRVEQPLNNVVDVDTFRVVQPLNLCAILGRDECPGRLVRFHARKEEPELLQGLKLRRHVEDDPFVPGPELLVQGVTDVGRIHRSASEERYEAGHRLVVQGEPAIELPKVTTRSGRVDEAVDLLLPFFQNGLEEHLFRLEVVEQGGMVDTGAGGDLADAGAEKPLGAEEVARRGDDVSASMGPTPVGRWTTSMHGSVGTRNGHPLSVGGDRSQPSGRRAIVLAEDRHRLLADIGGRRANANGGLSRGSYPDVLR